MFSAGLEMHDQSNCSSDSRSGVQDRSGKPTFFSLLSLGGQPKYRLEEHTANQRALSPAIEFINEEVQRGAEINQISLAVPVKRWQKTAPLRACFGTPSTTPQAARLTFQPIEIVRKATIEDAKRAKRHPVACKVRQQAVRSPAKAVPSERLSKL